MKTKRALLAVLLVAMLTVLAAGMVSANERRGRGDREGREGREGRERRNREPQRKEWQNKEQREIGDCGAGCRMHGMFRPGMRAHRRMNADRVNAREIPQEIREKWAEAQKISIDLRTELGRDSVDRDRALELHAKRRAIMQEISDWRFMQRLDRLTDR